MGDDVRAKASGATVVHSIGELADAADVAYSTAWAWVKKHGAPQAKGGGWDVAQVQEWNQQRVKQIRKRGRPAALPAEDELLRGQPVAGEGETADELQMWAAKYRKARVAKELLVIGKMKGELVERSAVAGMLQKRLVDFQRRAESAAVRSAKRVVGLGDERQILRVIREELDAALEVYRRPLTEEVG